MREPGDPIVVADYMFPSGRDGPAILVARELRSGATFAQGRPAAFVGASAALAAVAVVPWVALDPSMPTGELEQRRPDQHHSSDQQQPSCERQSPRPATERST